MSTAEWMGDRWQPLWEAWGAYIDHVRPISGQACIECTAPGTPPGKGCEEGRRLYDAYRAVRVS